MLTNIHPTIITMTIRSHRGTQSTNLIRDLAGYLDPVYFDPEVIANILSLSTVKKYHRVTYDSKGTNNFTINKQHGNIIIRECFKGLFYHDTTEHCTVLTTVEQKRTLHQKTIHRS